nr:MAG: DNA pilot protein [Microvirus sp.]
MAISAGVAAIGGSLISGLLGMSGAKSQNKQNALQAQKNRDFQERMSSTSHQREVTDLRAAGLNPILSASKGASSPGGAQAQMTNELEPMANSAKDIAMQSAQLKLIEAQTAKTGNESKILGKQALINDYITTGLEKIIGYGTNLVDGSSASDLKHFNANRVTPMKRDKPLPEKQRPYGNSTYKKAQWMLKNGYTFKNNRWTKK